MSKIEKTKLTRCWEEFNNIAEKYGYSVITHNDNDLGIGTTCYKTDSFSPIIQLCIWPALKDKNSKKIIEPTSYSVHVEDRNGNNVLSGPLCAVYTLEEAKISFDDKAERVITDCENFDEKFTKMCTDVFEKYSKYFKGNRMDFTFNELEVERVNYFNK